MLVSRIFSLALFLKQQINGIYHRPLNITSHQNHPILDLIAIVDGIFMCVYMYKKVYVNIYIYIYIYAYIYVFMNRHFTGNNLCDILGHLITIIINNLNNHQ
jgi:hypothetical protein